jgi:hypothetical protein
MNRLSGRDCAAGSTDPPPCGRCGKSVGDLLPPGGRPGGPFDESVFVLGHEQNLAVTAACACAFTYLDRKQMAKEMTLIASYMLGDENLLHRE